MSKLKSSKKWYFSHTVKSQNHRITKWLWLEQTSGRHLVQSLLK